MARAAAGVADPEATEDELREAARLRTEAREAAEAERRKENDASEAAVDDIIRRRRAARRGETYGDDAA